jgi:CubicO group peptidase (beta-lactamase class C family)
MGQNQLGALTLRPLGSLNPQFLVPHAALPGSPDVFGLGFALNSKPLASGRGARSMSWGGIFNTFFWIDREKQIGAVFLSQSLPFLDPESKKVLEDFDRAVYAWNRPASAGGR